MRDGATIPSWKPAGGLSATAMAAWLGVQLAALGVSAFRFRIWARQPQAAEQSALAMMLITQIGVASLIFPLLLRNIRSTIVAVTTAWPLAFLASFLADADVGSVVRGEAYVSAWLVGLFLIGRTVRGERGQLAAIAIAGMVALGSPSLWYLRADFNPDVSATTNSMIFFGPIGGALSQIFPDHSSNAEWTYPSGLLACGVVCNLTYRMRYAKKIK